MTITQRIAALTGGVSQRPQSQRASGQAEAQTNALNHPLRGLLKRPPLEHFAKLSADTDGLEEGFIHSIDLSPTERFIALIRDGALTVFDKITGGQIEVISLHADEYVTPVEEEQIHLIDSFTDTNGTTIENHVPSIGGQWTRIADTSFGSGLANIQSNLLRAIWPGPGTMAHYRLDPYEVPVNDYMVTVNTSIPVNLATAQLYLTVRGNKSNLGCYVARIRYADPLMVDIRRYSSAGASTTLLSEVSTGIACTVPQDISLRVTGNFLEILVNGTVIGSATDATNLWPTGRSIGMKWEVTSSSANRQVEMDTFRLTYTPAASSGPAPFKAAQVGKQTIIANTTVNVERGTEAAPGKEYKALVVIRQADFGTQYRLTIAGQEVGYGSPEGVTPQTRVDIDTTNMALKLKSLIELEPTLDAFTVTPYGSTLLIERADGADFTIASDDGLADNGLLVIKGSVQAFSDLPLKAPEGYTVEITGDASTQFDNYFVKFDVADTATNAGVWKECVRPDEPITLDAATMPHVLTYKGSYFPESQAAGTPPSPSIVPGVETLDWETNQWDAIGDADEDETLFEHGDFLTEDIAADGFEGNRLIEVYFRVTTVRLPADKSIIVKLEYEDGAASNNWLEADRAVYGPGFSAVNQKLSAVLALVADQKIRLRLYYPTGAPALVGGFPLKHAWVTTNKETTTQFPAIRYVNYTGRDITFPATYVYPQGKLLRITADGVNFDYTPVTDVTGAAVATALQLLIHAHANYTATNPSAGRIYVERVDAADPVITSTITWSEVTDYHDPELSQTASALVGKTIRNLTDNSEGVVTANTSTTITVAALTGGADNTFQKDDKVEVVSTGRYFTFGQGDWAERAAGDLTTNPMPSFVDQKINDVFITKGRLGFVSGGNIVLSEAGKLFNMFRTTVVQLLDGDPIDVKPAHGEAIRFHSYAAWDGRDIFWSGRHQFELSGEPILSPQTVKLLPISEYPNDALRPVVLGRHAFFVAKRQAYSQVYQYGVMENQDRPHAEHLTRDVSQYIEGNALAHAGDEDLGLYALLTDADRSGIYVCTFDRESKHLAWSRWQFPSEDVVVGLSFLDGQLIVLSQRSDGFYLDTCDVDSEESASLLDRKSDYAAGEGTFSSPNTTWTLPYSCATDGSEGTVVIVNAATGATIASTRPTATTVRAVGDFSAVAVVIGIRYTLSHTLSTIFPLKARGEGAEPVTEGRLQLSRMRINYEDTRDFTVTVTPSGRAARTYSVDEDTNTDGTLVVPVLSKNKDVSIVISSAEPTACRITDVEWEGTHHSRSRRV